MSYDSVNELRDEIRAHFLEFAVITKLLIIQYLDLSCDQNDYFYEYFCISC